ncbi:MAG: D-alanyl-D-alanine carboxypeptidase/D-alanyl-D-alanine-endopeptidase [Myxococcota bacterium]|nr:D-alanyl-D-alanine carboxypeptidase/D-alanyl-D-alanine-endopeptidase [Myxococcota bacterium]
MDTWLKRADLQGVSIGVSVRDVATGEVLAEHRADQLMNPASGTKLLTTSAALLALGPEHRWTTGVSHFSQTLRLVGGGDPALLGEGLSSLAVETAQVMGEQSLETLVVDVSRHDAERVPPAFDQKSTDASYRPAVGPAGSHYGAFEVTVRPSVKPGEPLKVVVRPGGSAIQVVNRARTVFERAPDTPELAIGTRPGKGGRTRVVVSGALVAGADPVKTRRRAPDPDAMTGYLLRDALVARGVKARGARIVVAADVPPQDGERTLAEHKSAPLAEIVRDINVWSNNFMAEALMKELAQVSSGAVEGLSWPGGAQVVTEALIGLGVEGDGIRVVNGSGLYRATHVSAGAMTDLLVRMTGHSSLGKVFRESLGLAGGEGWLRRRLTGASTKGRVRAKTGTLDEVVSLSGLAPRAGGAEVAFSILVNDATPARTRKLRRAIDALVSKLVQLP